ncbi:MAG TPA: VTT domain-containing protein [Casimicrobiaceae bacterium]|nr:VTT domain-containing protein [Casimicrobiaceae bacterium]
MRDAGDSRARLRRRALVVSGVVLAALGALALAWRYTPLAQLATPENVTAFASAVAKRPWTPIALMLAYPIAAVIMFPRPLVTLFAVIAFGPVLGFVYAMLGIVTSASATYLVGRSLPEPTVERLLTRRLREVRALLQRRGLAGSIAISIVPVAPFIAVGAAAGAMRIPLHQYLAGVVIGHIPGTLTTTVFGHQLRAVLEDRGAKINYAIIAGAVVFFALMILVVRRWFARQLALVAPGRQDAGTRAPSRCDRPSHD